MTEHPKSKSDRPAYFAAVKNTDDIFQIVGALQAAQYIRCKSAFENDVCRDNDYTGYEIAMMKALTEALNFSYEIVIGTNLCGVHRSFEFIYPLLLLSKFS